MSYSNVRTLTGTCERCHSTLQSVAELLILSCDARPIRTDTVSSKSTISQISERIVTSTKTIKTLMKSVINYVHMITTKSVEICEGLTELSSTVVTFMELCSHIAYICAISFKDCCQAIPGLVDRYSICLAGLEIKLSCTRLKKTRIDDLSPQLIIDLCSNISKHISVLTNICKSADEKVREEGTRDQFKLCVKSVTCAAGCLIASIKTYKSHPNTRHHSRFLNFCDPVTSTAQALVSFATEEDFIGKEAVLTPEARDIQKSILAACMSIVSASIQLCKTVRELSYDLMTSHHKDKLRMCMDNVDRSSVQLREILQRYHGGDHSNSGHQPNFTNSGDGERGNNCDNSLSAKGSNSPPRHLANLFRQEFSEQGKSPDSPPHEKFAQLLREQSPLACGSDEDVRSGGHNSKPVEGESYKGSRDEVGNTEERNIPGSPSSETSGHSAASR
ncbi:talin rod domain-containing protein 1-like [Saccostrea echinata]|uniref:talin rod domain-containing protein 1-like n=1 Tax=Saccostrea echinata TaxID=191078 RepID=UPI002A813B02|nr:talin rod domain-containing protein 1-like [Saccostrea echinata]